MKKISYSIGFAALAALAALTSSNVALGQAVTNKEHIGTYDSRAIAIAYAGSPMFAKELQQLKADHDKAKAAGDLETAAKLEAQGKARQVALEKQGFGSASVDDILVRITNALPEIQRTDGVAAIISKWDEAQLKKHPGAETVDVTMKLVDAFQPNDKARKNAIEIQKSKPISAEEAEKIKD